MAPTDLPPPHDPSQRSPAKSTPPESQEGGSDHQMRVIGVMVGGMFEYLALATGYQSLLLLVVAFYALALVPWRRTRESGLVTSAEAAPKR